MLLGLYIRAQTMVQAAVSNLRTRLRDETGAVATEYVLLLVLIALAITGGMVYLAVQLNAQFSKAGSCLGQSGSC